MAEYEIKDGVGIIPEGTTEIGPRAFEKCTELKSIVIPDSVTELSWSAFEGCTNLKCIVLSKTLKKIDGSCFEGCSHLSDIVIPESVTYIGSSAFEGCTGLTNIVIPASVWELYNDTFNGCTGLTSIKVAEDNEKFDSRDNCNAVIITSDNRLIIGCKNTQIPFTVFSIGYEAFKGKGLVSIEIPNHIVSIGGHCFEDNESLESVTLGKSIKELGEYIFKGCDNLKRVVINVEAPTQIQTERGVELGGYQSTLYVPDTKGVLAAYKKKAIWKKFAAIETFAAETGQNEGNDEWASFLELIGMKDSKLKLKPISPEYDIKDMLTVTYHVTEDMLPFTAILDDDRAIEMYVDDQVVKPFKKKVTFKKAGDHVIRLFAGDLRPYKLNNCLNYEGSELIKIPDSMTHVKPAKWPEYGTFRGSRKLLLGEGYTGVEYIGSFKLERIPENDFEELDVVPANAIYESRNGCIIRKEDQTLMYVSASTTTLSENIKMLRGSWIMQKWSQPKLLIPGSVNSLALDLGKVGCAEEIEFCDGVQEIELIQNGETQVKRIILPSSVIEFKAPANLKKLVEKK